MKANTLRQGNWIKTDLFNHTVIKLGFLTINGSPEWIYNPISLTEKIFRDNRFAVIDDNPKQKPQYEGDILVDICGFEFTNSQTGLFINNRRGFYSYGINNGETILYSVHELQNFCFTIEGKEHIINLLNK